MYVNWCKVPVTSEGFCLVITSSVYMNGVSRQLEGSSVGKFAGWRRVTPEGSSMVGVICWRPFGGLSISTSDKILSCILIAKYM